MGGRRARSHHEKKGPSTIPSIASAPPSHGTSPWRKRISKLDSVMPMLASCSLATCPDACTWGGQSHGGHTEIMLRDAEMDER